MSDQDINDLLKVFDNPCHCYPLNVVEAIRLLVKQRDEARRIACDNESALNGLMFDDPRLAKPHFVAKQRNWDCFKETDNA